MRIGAWSLVGIIMLGWPSSGWAQDDNEPAESANEKEEPTNPLLGQDFPDVYAQRLGGEGDQEMCRSDPVETEILKDLRQRRLQIEAREANLARGEQLLRQLERRLMRRIDIAVKKVERLEKQLLVGDYGREDREKKLAVLAQSVQTVSARKVAPVLEKTDADVAVDLLMRLGPKRAGELLGKMSAQQAAKLIDRIATQKTAAQRAAAATRGAPKQ
jgi:flagellar motility protein MotE (MotC chaperone)